MARIVALKSKGGVTIDVMVVKADIDMLNKEVAMLNSTNIT